MQVPHLGPPGNAYEEEPTQTEESWEQKGRPESCPEPGTCPGLIHRKPVIPRPTPAHTGSVACCPGEIQPGLCLGQPPSPDSDENPML